jgi:hypothetical protein
MNSANNTNTDTDIAHMIARLVLENDNLRVHVTDLEDANSALRREMIEQTPTDTEPTDTQPEAPEAPTIEEPTDTQPEAPIATEPTVPTVKTVSLQLAEPAILESDIKGIKNKKAVIAEWKRATANLADHSDVDVFWAHVQAYVQKEPVLSTRLKRIGQIKSVTKRLDLPVKGAFEDMYTVYRNEHSAAVKCKQVSLPEIVTKFGCTDGTLLTTQKLQDFVETELALPPTDTDTGALLCLAFFSHHGNRGEDLCGMRYGESNYHSGDYGYYDPDTRTAHLWGGKTATSRGYVHFEVHPRVSAAIDRHHSNMPAASAWVFPLKNGGQSTTDPLRTILHDTYFKEGNPYGFPANINPTDFRHLYETHIRHVLALQDAELDGIMKIIGHSNKTSVEMYSQMYVKMLKFNQT